MKIAISAPPTTSGDHSSTGAFDSADQSLRTRLFHTRLTLKGRASRARQLAPPAASTARFCLRGRRRLRAAYPDTTMITEHVSKNTFAADAASTQINVKAITAESITENPTTEGVSRASIATNDVRPAISPGEHPIRSKRYVITTPQVVALCSEAVNLVENRSPGAVIWAPPRTGKSRALEILQLEFAEVFPGMPVMFLPAWDYTTPREGAFMEDLLKAAGHAIVKRGRPEDKRERLVELMADFAIEKGEGRIVLIVDEAQQLHEKHYKWLMGIHNLLAMYGVHMITLLVGQHQLVHQRTAFLRAGKENIVGRFMVQMFQFHGIQDQDELAESLAAYDVEEYPIGSGWSYTRFFAPKLVASGWRLQAVAPLLWGAFYEARQLAPANKAPKEIQMQYFCRTVEYVLQHLDKVNVTNEDAMRKLMKTAIAASRYLDVLLVDAS